MATVGTPGAIQTPPISSGNLGQGLAYPLGHSSGRLTLSNGVQSVRDSLKAICLTTPGERVMQPDFGAAVSTFDPVGLSQFKAALQKNIADHEPRVKQYNLSVAMDPATPGAAIVQISFYTSEDASPDTLTFPAFVGPSE